MQFNLPDASVRWTLHAVHWLQAVWLIAVGTLLFAMPQRRLGSSFQFIIALPGSQYVIATAFLLGGLTLAFALKRDHQHLAGRALQFGGLTCWAFAIFLTVGAARGPTGGFGTVFTLYVGAHMLLQSVLLRRALAPR